MSEQPGAKQLEGLWSGNFGDDYVDRNSDTVQGREPFWRELLDGIEVGSALEVGCNIGPNLYWLARYLGPDNVAGVDMNDKALAMARENVPGVDVRQAPARELPFDAGQFDLVFTTGVLIHQPPDMIDTVIREIHRVSRRYVLAGEYFAERQEEVSYRGQPGSLFRDDFGGRYERLFPDLELVGKRFIPWSEGVWDDMTFWTYEKPR